MEWSEVSPMSSGQRMNVSSRIAFLSIFPELSLTSTLSARALNTWIWSLCCSPRQSEEEKQRGNFFLESLHTELLSEALAFRSSRPHSKASWRGLGELLALLDCPLLQITNEVSFLFVGIPEILNNNNNNHTVVLFALIFLNR